MCKNYIKLEVNIINAGTSNDEAIICYNEDRTEIKAYVTGMEAEILTDVLLGLEGLADKCSHYRLYKKKGDENEMRFQTIDNNGNVVEKDLTYESALMCIDSVDGKYYIMQPVKEED